MIEIKQEQQEILVFFLKYGRLSSSELHRKLSKAKVDTSLVTVERQLGSLAAGGGR